MPLPLSAAAADLPYDRSRVTPGIVHLGVGAFCRAHIAAYVDALLAGDPSWGIVGASLRRSDTRDALLPQDFLYTLVERGPDGTTARVIGALLDVLDATRQGEALLAAMAAPGVRIVSLTVTEKGYCHDPATGRLNPDHPDIRHDLAHPDRPVSAPGFIVRAIALRRARGLPPFTVLSCDNLPANGETTRRVVTDFAALVGADLADHIRDAVAFPSSMVDRIVPATTDEDRQAVVALTGRADAWPVVTEPFSQWVIEDRFASGRPPFDAAGAQFVEDVRPYELMKLRMLNGSHSTLAYLGYLAGHATVSDTVADPAFRRLAFGLMTDEVMDTLPPGLGDLGAYRDALLARFANPTLRHRTWQIAMDGSQKLPQRLLGTIGDRLARGQPFTRAALGVAGWMRYVGGIDEGGAPIDVRDPLAPRLRAISDAAGGRPEAIVDGLLGVREIFGPALAADDRFRAVLTRHLAALTERGAAATVAGLA